MSIPRSDKIILDHSRLVEKVRQLRSEGKTIVFTNGCFDLIHVGHIRYLRGAAECADVLLLALNSDESIRALKGANRPVMPLEKRLEIAAAFECVDIVTSFNAKKCDELLMLIKPDVHAKGTDYTYKNVPERETVLSYGGKIAIVGDPKDHSTSNLLEELREKNNS